MAGPAHVFSAYGSGQVSSPAQARASPGPSLFPNEKVPVCVCVRGEGEERRAEAEGLKPGTWQTVLRLQGTGKEAQAQKA